VVPRWIGRAQLARADVAADAEPAEALRDHIVLCGFGRVGSAVAEALETFDRPYVAIERDPEIVRGLRARGVACLYGDASNRRILEAAGAPHAALAVIALPDAERVYLAVSHLREMNPGVPILARSHHADERERLLAAGASEVIQPELEAASTLIRHALRRLSLPRERVLAYLEHFRDALELTWAPESGAAERLPELREVTLDAGVLTNRTLRDARVRERFGVSVMAITRADGTLVLHPSADTLLRRGDRVRLFGLPEQLEALLAHADPSG
jgi:CPA2 family monovalent cation:H+ antiporter-2